MSSNFILFDLSVLMFKQFSQSANEHVNSFAKCISLVSSPADFVLIFIFNEIFFKQT